MVRSNLSLYVQSSRLCPRVLLVAKAPQHAPRKCVLVCMQPPVEVRRRRMALCNAFVPANGIAPFRGINKDVYPITDGHNVKPSALVSTNIG